MLTMYRPALGTFFNPLHDAIDLAAEPLGLWMDFAVFPDFHWLVRRLVLPRAR
jgi:hypothetical protein